jgi:hypothetical protein
VAPGGSKAAMEGQAAQAERARGPVVLAVPEGRRPVPEARAAIV